MAKRIRKTMGRKITIAFIILLLGGAIALSILFAGSIFDRPYVAVHLTNGDTYFGQLYRFPKLQLGDVHIIQPITDQEDPELTSLQVVPLNLIAFWGPDKLQLNRDQIIFIAEIGEESQVMQIIRRSKEATAQ